MNGAELIAEERKRQIEKEGWDSEHDVQHTQGELAMAAACYALGREQVFVGFNAECKPQTFDPWPWWDTYYRYSDGPPARYKAWDKRGTHPRLRQLVIAGALIAAEIDRIQTE
jgi:hypothetical protein